MRNSARMKQCLLAVLVFASPLVNPIIGEAQSADSTTADAASDAIVRALEGYHFTTNAQELEAIAGSEEALVSRLLALRTEETPPFVGIRAVKVLMEQYSEREDVRNAFASDMGDRSRTGIARTLVAHIDTMGNENLRRELATQAVQRASADDSFKIYARSLRSSADAEVRRIASEQN